MDSDTEVGAGGGEEADETVPAHGPQVFDLDTDAEMGEEVDNFRALFTDDWTGTSYLFTLDHPFTGTPGLLKDWPVNTQPLQLSCPCIPQRWVKRNYYYINCAMCKCVMYVLHTK